MSTGAASAEVSLTPTTSGKSDLPLHLLEDDGDVVCGTARGIEAMADRG